MACRTPTWEDRGIWQAHSCAAVQGVCLTAPKVLSRSVQTVICRINGNAGTGSACFYTLAWTAEVHGISAEAETTRHVLSGKAQVKG